MTFDRSKYKATAVANLKSQEQQQEAIIGRGGGRPGYIKDAIKEGANKFRIYPAHPGQSEFDAEKAKSFLYPKTVHWIPQEVLKDADKPEKGSEVKNRPVFNSRVHAGTEKDIIEAYVAYVHQLVYDKTKDANERAKLLFPVTDWKNGIMPKTTWVVYAHKIFSNGTKEFGRLEVPVSVKDRMSALSSVEDSSSTITTDPFTDPTEGKAIVITYTEAAKPAKKYSVDLEFRGNYALTDDELETFDKNEPLESILTNCYKKSDFDKALRGLQIFDAEKGFGAFSQEAWLDVCTEIAGQYPDEEEEASGEVEETEEPSDVEKDQFDEMDRSALKKFIKTNTLPITVMSNYKDEDIRAMIRETLKEETEEEPEGGVEETDDEVESLGTGPITNDLPFDKPEVKSKIVTKSTAASATTSEVTRKRLDALRKTTGTAAKTGDKKTGSKK